jgi:CheY-like chemotaxis protein
MTDDDSQFDWPANQPGNRVGSGAASVPKHMDNDSRRATLARSPIRLDRSNYTVLVVDDDPASQYDVSRGLRAAGFKTKDAVSGAECLELADKVCAVVLDVHLPDIHGFEICRLLRSNPSTALLPIVHVSAVFKGNDYRAHSREVGADAYLAGPILPAALASLLEGLLENPRV